MEPLNHDLLAMLNGWADREFNGAQKDIEAWKRGVEHAQRDLADSVERLRLSERRLELAKELRMFVCSQIIGDRLDGMMKDKPS